MCIRDRLSSKQKERAFQEVRWGKRPENIKVLELFLIHI